MATYQYQQSDVNGAEVGYVKYNITPALGTSKALFPGDTFVVSGVLYVGGYVPSQISVCLLNNADVTSPGYLLEPRSVAGKKAAEVSFTMLCTVPNTSYDASTSFPTKNYYVSFIIDDVSEENPGMVITVPNVNQYYTIATRNRLAPTVSNVTFTDDAGYYTTIGGFVQGQSVLHVSFDEQTDPLDDSITIVKRVLEIGTYADGVFNPVNKYELNSNDASLGVLNLSGELMYRLTVTDSYDQTGGNKSMLFLFDYGIVSGYNWASNQFSRPLYTGTAGGAVHEDSMTITMPRLTGSNLLSYNAHVCTADVVSVPAGASIMHVSAYKTTETVTYLRFGMLPTNASNSYSTAKGGQLSTESALTTTETDYTMALSDAVKVATNMKCIVNARANMRAGVAKANAVITRVWFE